MKKASHIGALIQAQRHKKQLTQEELAIKSGVSYTTLIKIERGSVKNPTISTIEKIANALGISIDRLIKSAKTE